MTSSTPPSEPDRSGSRFRGVRADPGRSEGGRTGGGAVRDPEGETAGGDGGDVADGLDRFPRPGREASRPGRGMAGYLLYPRPEAWPKALIAPACFLFAASSTGDFRDGPSFLVLWLLLERLIYPARYQWNDIRGIDADQEHAEKDARSRLPVGTTHASRRRAIRVSRAAALTRVLAALLIGALTGLARPTALLAAAVFTIAAVLLARCRSRPARWAVTAAGFPALVGGALAGAAARPVLAGVPWAAIAVTCSGFSACSYRDLIDAGPRRAAALRRAGG